MTIRLLPWTALVLVACGATDDAPVDTDDTRGEPPAGYVDADEDGFPEAVDCDDDDAATHPGAVDQVGNGVDEDCSGSDGVPQPSEADGDGDGYASLAYRGTDCDDEDAAVHPDAAEARDGFDQDCDGADFDARLLEVGELVVTEILYDPNAVSDAVGEWFEVQNATDAVVSLRGLVVADDSAFAPEDQFTVLDDVVLEPGQRAVLGANGEPAVNGGIVVDYDFRGLGVSLDNSADDVVLGRLDGRSVTVIDAVSFDETAGWPAGKGFSIELKDGVDAEANDAPGNWCLATGTAGDTADKGSPGAPSSGC